CDDAVAVPVGEWARLHNKRRRAAQLYCRDCSIQFGYFSNAFGLQLHSCGTDRLLRGLVAVLAVRPRCVPEIVNYPVRLDHLPRHIHQLSTQFRKDIAEPSCVLSGTRQALDQPYRYRVADTQEYDRDGRGLTLGRYRGA